MKPSTTTPTPLAPEASARWSLPLWGLLFVLAGNMLIDALEVSVAVVALPSIGDDLHLSLRELQWTMSGFALGFGALILFGGRVVSRLGRRRVYLVALIVFAAASLAGALATGGPLLVATRFVKGVCAALTAPTGLAIIISTFKEGPARNRAVSVYTLFGASGFSLGLLLSGWLTQESWRWTFAFPAPVALLLFLFGLRLIPDDVPAEHPRRPYDLMGAATLTTAAVALVYALSTAPVRGWGDPRPLGALALVAVSLIAFVIAERVAERPLVRFGALRNRPLLRSALGAAALNGSYLGLLFVSTFHLQWLLGWSPLQTALAFLPASLPLAAASLFSGRMVSRFQPSVLIAAGAVAPPVGYALYFRLGTPTEYVTDILPTMTLVGVGFVLSFAAFHFQAISAAPAAEREMTGGIYQTAVQFGAAVMLALVSALLMAHRPAPGATAEAVLDGYRPALALIGAVGTLGLLVALSGVRRRLRPAAHPSD